MDIIVYFNEWNFLKLLKLFVLILKKYYNIIYFNMFIEYSLNLFCWSGENIFLNVIIIDDFVIKLVWII